MESCTGFGNTGYYQNCDSNFKVMRGLFVVPTFDGDGVRNKVAAGTEIDDDFISDMINESDPLKRWYPVMPIEAATAEREDPTVYTNPSGSKEFVKDGVKNLSFELRRRGAEFKGQIESCPCSELSFFAIDADGKLRGLITGVNENSDFYPIAIQPGSFYSKLIDATEDNPEHLKVDFQYELTVRDSLLRTYPSNLLTADNILATKGLYDVFGLVTVPIVTGFTVDFSTIYTDGDNYKPEGLLAADFALYNETDESAVVITSVTEVSPGKYDFVIPAQSVADVLTLTPTKLGFDFTEVIENMPITIGA
jgi:hypothetical protein